ncbi:MAG: hypothetical protein QOJ29_3443 [Thermoleophilaceae bacterium]|jgi:hypothetical protein|nr:hypothetical protein [Thermoleophilaceae bacterium]
MTTLKSLNKPELEALAEEHGVDAADLNKDALIEALEKAGVEPDDDSAASGESSPALTRDPSMATPPDVLQRYLEPQRIT